MSDRSVHTDTIRESVVVTGDGNTVVATFGTTGARLTLQRRQVRGIDRRRAPRPGEPPRELDLFAPDTDALPLLGREPLLQQLRDWLDDEGDLSVYALVGQAGSGKTRLALELCRAVDPADGSGVWRAAIVAPSAIGIIVETLVTRSFEWDRSTLLVLDYAATAYRALARWLDALCTHRQTPKLRFLLLEREAPEQFGWWQELARPSLHSEANRADLFWQSRPMLLPDLTNLGERHALLLAAQQATRRLRGFITNPAPIPVPEQDLGFDRALAAPRFGNPLNLVMAGVIACDQSPLGALGLRRLDAAAKLGNRERQRLAVLAEARSITQPVIQHMVAFNGLAGGLPVADLPDLVARELAAWGTTSDAQVIASLLVQELPPSDTQTATPRLGTIQPDLIGESVIVQSFEGENFLPQQAAPTVRRAYALGQTRAAEALVRIVQDFAYALEDQAATAAERTRGTAVLGWLTELLEQTADPATLLPLAFALPAQTLVLREPSARLTQVLSDTIKHAAETSEDHEFIGLSAMLLNNLSLRLSAVGRREAALATAEEAAVLYRALAEARPDAFTADLARSLNNLATMLSDLGRREAALATAEEAVVLYRALAEARPDAFTANLASSLNNLANMLSDVGRREAALATAEEAVRLRRALAEARPDAFTADLALSLSNVANMLSDVGRREAALATAEEAVRLRRALAEARPDAFTADLALSLNNLANMLSDVGRREAALATAEEAVVLYRALAEVRPDAFTADLARSLWVLGDQQAEAGAQEASLATLADAVQRLTPVFDAYPVAVHDMMVGLAQSYIKRCEEAGREPDDDILAL